MALPHAGTHIGMTVIKRGGGMTALITAAPLQNGAAGFYF
jgi:hypothetical protein